MEALAPVVALGLPVAALLILAGYGVDRLLRAGERRGFFLHRSWTSAGVGNALLELHLAFDPQRARIETRLHDRAHDDDVGDGRKPGLLPSNVIPIDFRRRRRP